MNLNEWRRRSWDIDYKALAFQTKSYLPGITLCLVAVMAATFITEHYGGPVLLIALLLGMAFNNLMKNPEYTTGLNFCATHVLRLGVALLGARLVFSDVSELGSIPYTLTGFTMVGTFLASYAIGMLLKIDTVCVVISAAAVAICGISAAIAIAAVLPMQKKHEQHLLCTIAGVAGISTLAMVFYPALTDQLGMNNTAAGLFIGSTIHDVAQVAGAGYLVSESAGDLAIYTKMIRVAALLPLVLLISLLFKTNQGRVRPPGFLIGFIALAILSNTSLLPESLLIWCKDSSSLLLLIAIVALGARTNLSELWAIGWKPFALLAGNTLIIAVISIGYLWA